MTWTQLAARPVRPASRQIDSHRTADVVESARLQCRNSNIDGLFLTAVSHFGTRIPTERLVRTLELERDFRAVVVDGAQDFCHASAELSREYCDLYLTGCHKWLRAFHPMGLGFYGRNSTRGTIQHLLQQLIVSGELDDPLLRFTTQLENTQLDGETETVNLVSLFTCQGAAADALDKPRSLSGELSDRRQNAVQLAALAGDSGWLPLQPSDPFRTGILLAQADRNATKALSGRELRAAFGNAGVALTAYDRGIVRFSVPFVVGRQAR